MADANARKEQKGSEKDQRGVQRRENEPSMSRRSWDPLAFPLNPAEFFGSDPFTLMRRFFGRENVAWQPPVEVREREGQLQVQAELPGLKPEQVKVEVTDDALIIEGERNVEHEEEHEGIYRTERRYGHFYRAIPLPEGVRTDQVKAEFRDGVLQVNLPLAEKKSSRRTIQVQSGSSEKAA